MTTWKDLLGALPIAALLAALVGTADADGNVLVFVDGSGDLRVIGDDLANRIRVYHEEDSEMGEYLVDALDATTTVNGQAAVTLIAPGEVLVQLGGGDDRALLGATGMGFTATVDAGAGNDLVEIIELSTIDVDVATGPGNDRLELGEEVGGELFAHLGAGDDRLSSLEFSGEVEIVSGDGDDHLEFQQFGQGRLDIATGAGADSFVVTGERFGPPPPGTFLITHFTVDLGPDDDRLQVGKTSIVFPVMDGGAGRDAFLEPGGVHYFTTPDIRSFEIARATSRDDLAITTTLLGRIVLEDGTPVPGASVALPELGLLTTTRPDGSFAFEILVESETALELTAGATLRGRRVTGAALVAPTEAPLSLVGDVVLARERENALVFGSPIEAAALAANLEALGLRPEQVTRLPSLAPDLSHYAVVWHVGRRPTAEEEERLAGFLRGGGGLHLSGFMPTSAFEAFLDQLLATDVAISPTSASGAHAFNPGAVGAVATVPNALTQFASMSGSRNLVGVGDHNVLVARTGGQVFGGAWDASNLAGGRGRLTAVMNDSWVEPGESLDVLENLLTFLRRQPKAQPLH